MTLNFHAYACLIYPFSLWLILLINQDLMIWISNEYVSWKTSHISCSSTQPLLLGAVLSGSTPIPRYPEVLILVFHDMVTWLGK